MKQKHTFDYDLIVIGSGAAGSTAASIVAGAKKRVAIVEFDKFGGDSANYSDVPIATLSHIGNIYNQARAGSKFGIRSNIISYNYPSVKSWKDYVIKRTGAGGSKKYYEGQGIIPYSGLARFITPNEITVNRRHLSARKFLIATGSSWQKPPIHGLELVDYLTPHTVLNLLKPPKSLAIIGAGITGVELAQIMANFGTKVYLIEQQPVLLPDFDPEIGKTLEQYFKKFCDVSVITNSPVVSVLKDGSQKRLIVKRGNVEKSLKVDNVLVACGQKPNTDIGLENATVEHFENGILTNKYLQTNVPHIFAAGKVTISNFDQAHDTINQAKTVAYNILHGEMISPDYKGSPKIISTQPMVATVGQSESYLKSRKIKFKVSSAPLTVVAKSNTSDFYDGFVKIISSPSGKLLGASIVAPHANEMISELSLAIRHNITVKQLASTPHPFLSWSEAVRVASSKN